MIICLINEHILRLMTGDNHSFMVSAYVSPNKVFDRVESLLPMLQVRVDVLMVLVQFVEVACGLWFLDGLGFLVFRFADQSGNGSFGIYLLRVKN